MRGHEWFHISRTLRIWFCGRCGIIRLNNSATERVCNSHCKGRETEDGR